MKITKELKFMSGYTKVFEIFFAVVTILIAIFFFVGENVYPDERDNAYSDYQEFESQWYRIMENGERVPVEIPGKVEAEHGEVVTLCTTLPENIYNRETICFRTIWQDVEIYIDGELRESYNTKDTRPFGKNSAFRYVFVELYEEDGGKELTYKFSSESKYAGVTRASYIGDRASIWIHLLGVSGSRTVIALFLLLFSTACIGVCAILKFVYKKPLSLQYLAWAIFLCAFWMLSEIEFRQIFFRNVSVLTNFTYWTLMLIPFPLLLYMNDIQERRYEKVYFFPWAYGVIMFIVGTLLQIFDVVQFVQQIPFIHIGTFSAIICVIVTISIDAIKKQLSNYISVAVGIYGMLLTAVVEVGIYYVGTNISLGTILAVGLLFLLAMAVVKTGQDLFQTEQKKQQAITAKEAQAKFLASMSHEIRTPINAVIGMNEMIMRENENETIQEYAYNIQRASNMLLELVNEVLDFSKVEAGKLELVNETYSVAPMVQDEILLLNARAKDKPITVKIDVDSKLPSKLCGDELRIKQVLTNLLSNAVKYTNEGKVTLRAFFQWIDNDTINLGFSVSDTGVGIKEEDLSGLFDSFKRLELSKNRNIEGTGLGLNIVKGLVDLMQGNIYVKSEYGKGSTFSIFIPQKVVDKEPIGNLIDEEKKPAKKKQESTGYVIAPNVKVLVVDDNSMNRTVLKELLKRTEVKLDLAKSGEECLEITQHKKYDIILLDHMMPGLDGIETLQKLREDSANPNQNTVVFALTANAIAGSREMYLENGFNDYISKPVSATELDALFIKYLPESLVTVNGTVSEEQRPVKEQESDWLYLDKNIGMFYCNRSEELYQEFLYEFCKECKRQLAKLEANYRNSDWERYANISAAIKTNALNIGAINFFKLSLQHEIAGREEDLEFIEAEYWDYVRTINSMIEKLEKERQ